MCTHRANSLHASLNLNLIVWEREQKSSDGVFCFQTRTACHHGRRTAAGFLRQEKGQWEPHGDAARAQSLHRLLGSTFQNLSIQVGRCCHRQASGPWEALMQIMLSGWGPAGSPQGVPEDKSRSRGALEGKSPIRSQKYGKSLLSKAPDPSPG